MMKDVFCYHIKSQWFFVSLVEPRLCEGSRTITRKDSWHLPDSLAQLSFGVSV